MRIDADDHRIRREITTEASSVVHLRDETDIRKGRPITETIAPARRLTLDLNLERLESKSDPLTNPARDCLIARTELAS